MNQPNRLHIEQAIHPGPATALNLICVHLNYGRRDKLLREWPGFVDSTSSGGQKPLVRTTQLRTQIRSLGTRLGLICSLLAIDFNGGRDRT